MEQLSGLDASFLYLETPRMHLHVAMCAVLDPREMPNGYRFETIVEHIRERVHLVPPFRRRLREDPLGLNHPFWVEDPDLDLIHHVRRVTLPAPGGMAELGEMIGRINSVPLPRSRPLWEIWVIEGLRDGRFAIVAKVHHAAVDGTSGAGLLVNFFSVQRNAPAPKKPKKAQEPETIPSDIEMLREAARARLAQPRKLVELAQKTVQAVRAVADRRKGTDVAVGGTPLRAPRVAFNGALAAKRDAAFARLPLDGLKAIKNAADGVKLNDVILAIGAGLLRNYLLAKDGLPDEPLMATCPISVGGSRGSNHVSAMFVPLPVHLENAAERLGAIHRSTQGAKEEHHALGAEMLQDWAELAAPTTFELAARFYTRLKLADRHRPVHNLIVSNVPGPPFPIYFAGAELEAIYPMGPVLEGSGLNVTVMSYCGNVDFGFMVAKNLVPDVWDLAEAVHEAYRELRAAYGLERPSEPSEARPGAPAE